MKKFFRVFIFLIKLIIAYIFAFFIKIFSPTMRNVWVLSERGDDARDNGYFFYKYLIEKHPEIKVYYAIKKSAVDAKRIRQQDLLNYNSFKHFVFFALCTVCISSHASGGDIPYVDYYRKFIFSKRSKKKEIFLQHGIIKDYLPSLCYPKIRPNLFVCGAEPEWRYIHDNFNHPEGVVQYTGLARYDSLNEFKTKNQILVMPTFRKYLQGLDSEDFLQEEYYIKWQSLLSSPQIVELLEKNELNLIFYPHYEMQKYVDLFKSGSDRIKIADFNHYDVQTLLKESKLMVTDFSSVFFDFSYMQKPVVFYQFDRERYIKEHYDFTKGYFDYDTMAPGRVMFNENGLITELSAIIENDFSVKKEYKDRVDQFFAKSDNHNCDRIFEAIINL